jgi:hypothetical protein
MENKTCQRCNSNRLISVGCKHADLSWAKTLNNNDVDYEGYALCNTPWYDSPKYMQFIVCMECGQMKGTFPMETPNYKKNNKDND